MLCNINNNKYMHVNMTVR